MERIAQAEPGRSRWRREWSVLGLAALTIVVLVVHYRVSLWAFAALTAAPLTFLAVAALLLLPGLALLRWLWPHPLRPAERWSLALGISAGLPPVLFLLGESIGLRWNTWLCWAYLLLAALALCWPAGGARTPTIRSISPKPWELQDLRKSLRTTLDIEHLLLIGMTLIALAVQLYVARDLPVGMYGD